MSDIITITGNIATDPTRSTLPNGVPVTRFRLASAQRRYDREAGAWVDGSTNWYSVSAFRALADNAGASLHKGERVVVTGRLRLRAWENDGRKGMEVEIDADALGHDLRFGTTSFRRSGQRAAPGETAADGWAVPGEQPRDDEPAPPPEPSEPTEQAERAETPF